MSERSRAWRRAQMDRMKARVRWILTRVWREPHLVEPHRVGHMATTPKCCSCLMCQRHGRKPNAATMEAIADARHGEVVWGDPFEDEGTDAV